MRTNSVACLFLALFAVVPLVSAAEAPAAWVLMYPKPADDRPAANVDVRALRLKAGDEIQTRDDAEADLLLGGQAWIHLADSSVLRVERYDVSKGAVRFSGRLTGGRLFVKSWKDGKPEAAVSIHSRSLLAETIPDQDATFVFEITPPGLTQVQVVSGRAKAVEWREKTGSHAVSLGASREVQAKQKLALVMGASLPDPMDIPADEWSNTVAWTSRRSMPSPPGAQARQPDLPDRPIPAGGPGETYPKNAQNLKP